MDGFAQRFSEQHPHLANFVDPHEADEHAELLRANGLETLNEKVLASPAEEVLDLVAEHNVAVVLIRRGLTDLEYEPPSMARPVDFVGTSKGRLYLVEVKRLASNEHDELHATLMKTLNQALESHDERALITLDIAEAFERRDINPLVQHVKRSLRHWREGESYCFSLDGECLARYSFHLASTVEHPRVGIAGDADVRDVTGDDEARVQAKVKRAYRKFKLTPSDDALHLVILEADRTVHLSSVSDALYGREHIDFFAGGGCKVGRANGGSFCGDQHSRLGGLIVACRVAHRLFVPYDFSLFPNPGASLPVDEVVQALGVGVVFGPHDFP